MKQARTIVNNLREKLHTQPPFTNLCLSIKVHNVEASFWKVYSCDRYSPEDFATVLFDLSISGYYVSNVGSFIYDAYYTIEMFLELSERRKTNIDASVVQEVVKIAERRLNPLDFTQQNMIYYRQNLKGELKWIQKRRNQWSRQ